jgi:hypothetical protein
MSTIENDLEPVYSPAQISDWCGKHESVIRKAMHEGTLKSFRLGTDLRARRNDILEWLQREPVTGPSPLRDPRRHGHVPAGRPPRRRRPGVR